MQQQRLAFDTRVNRRCVVNGCWRHRSRSPGHHNFDFRILFPEPVPNSTVTFTVTPTSLFIHDSLPVGTVPEEFILDVNFNSPLTASAGAMIHSGYIERRGSVGIRNPFVCGAANVVPEPSSLLLLSTGVIGLVTRSRS